MNPYRLRFALTCLVVMVMYSHAWPNDFSGRADGLPPSFEQSASLPHRPENLEPQRMVAAQVSLLYCQDLAEVDKRIRNLAEAGFNTLILRVFHNEGDRFYRFAIPRQSAGVYFHTRYAPVVDDILGSVSRIAHRHGLAVFAWMTTRHANYGLENVQALRAVLYDFATGTFIPARGFNLFREEVVTRLEGLYADLARYPIDGILFQDDLILKHNEGFSTEARSRFAQDHGYTSEPSLFYGEILQEDDGRIIVSGYTDRFWTWTRWKNRQLLRLAHTLMHAARRVRPGLKFAINLYYESVLRPDKGMAWYSQSVEMARGFPFDYFSVMAYHRQIQQELGLTLEETLDLMPGIMERAIEMSGSATRVLMKIQVVDWKTFQLIPQEETEQILKILGENPEVHVAIVPYQPEFPTKTLDGVLRPRLAQRRQRWKPTESSVTNGPLPTSYPR